MLHLPLIAKVAIGVGTAVVGFFVVKKVIEPEKKYVYVKGEEPEVIDTKEELKEKAVEKAVEVVNWVNTHKEQVEGFVTILGVLSSIVGLANGIKQFGMKNKINKRLDILEKETKREMFWRGWNASLDETRKQISDAINDPKDNVFEILDYNGLSLLKVKCEVA